MTLFFMTLLVLVVAVRARRVIRAQLDLWFEQRAQEHVQGLPRGALSERWGTVGNGMTDDQWITHLERFERPLYVGRHRV